jgi:hypothetical protein
LQSSKKEALNENEDKSATPSKTLTLAEKIYKENRVTLS